MNCERCRDQLDGYRDEMLAPPVRADVGAHLDHCAECSRDLRASEALKIAVNRLPRTELPPDDLWPAIRVQLTAKVPRPAPRWALLAAAISLVVASSTITKLVVERGEASKLVGPVVAAEQTYLQLASTLVRELDRLRPKMAPETRAIVERNLAVIDAALRESREALAKDPHNHALEELLLSAYRQKIDWLKRAATYAKT